MMIAFDDGSLIEQINEGIREGVDVKCAFLELCSPNNTDEVNDLIYNFFLLRYKRMCGRWFVKSMQAEQGRKLKKVEDLPTRTRVMVVTEGLRVHQHWLQIKMIKLDLLMTMMLLILLMD